MREPYPSDLTARQWAEIASIFDTERGGHGRPREVPAREILNAILYVMKNGCHWRSLPHDFPHWNTVYRQRTRWSEDGTLFRAMARLQPVRHHTEDAAEYRPSVGIVDATFVESAYGGAQAAPSGYKRAMGHWTSVLIDKESYPMSCAILPGNKQDQFAAAMMIPDAKAQFPSLKLVLGDKAYRKQPLVQAMSAYGVIVDGDSPALPKGKIFEPMPLRWRVEQFFGWLCKWRRIAKNWCYRIVGFVLEVSWTLLGIAIRRFSKLGVN